MKKSIKILLFTAIVMLVIALIFFFSEQSGEQSHLLSSQLASRIADFWINSMERTYEPESYEILTSLIRGPLRKLAHIGIYTLLGLTTMSCFRGYFKKKTSLLHVLFTLCIVVIIAVCDEINQFYSGGRGSSVRDVFIDTIGGVSGCYLSYMITDFITHIKHCFRK